jgi:hypothetical protein
MIRRAAMLMGALLGAALAGCQNAPQQLSVYAPFGPAVVPPPTLTRANSTPYYTPPADPKGTADSPATASSPGNNSLSHYDPYQGLLVPGNFSPSPVAVRTGETWGTRDTAIASAPRERTSGEEPIRIVEGSSAPLVAQGRSRSSSNTNLSGAVKPTITLPPPPATEESAAEIASRPGSGSSSTPASSSAPASPAPASSPGIISPPPPPIPTVPAPSSNPAEPRRLSLWDSPRDGSRVMPAAHWEEATNAQTPMTNISGTWRARR